jgi:hypothetical protein
MRRWANSIRISGSICVMSFCNAVQIASRCAGESSSKASIAKSASSLFRLADNG